MLSVRKLWKVVVLFLVVAHCYAPVTQQAVAERSSRGQISAELLGAAVLYSAFGSYLLHPNIAGNLGISYISVSDSFTSSSSLLQFPVSLSALLGGPDSFLELLGGGDIVFASSRLSGSGLNQSFSQGGFIPEVGLGYRYWPADGGFHFRATLYGLISSGFYPWFGLSFGYAF